jgi:hypothetical protein
MPRGSFDNEQIKLGEFMGYTKNEFKNINETLERIENNLTLNCEASEKNREDIIGIKAQAGLIGSIAGAIASVLVAIVFFIMGK